jgi:hypothetical protein
VGNKLGKTEGVRVRWSTRTVGHSGIRSHMNATYTQFKAYSAITF